MAEPLPYVWINDGLIDDPVIRAMDDGEFMAKFRAAMRGERNEFAPYVRRQKHRPRSEPRSPDASKG